VGFATGMDLAYSLALFLLKEKRTFGNIHIVNRNFKVINFGSTVETEIVIKWNDTQLFDDALSEWLKRNPTISLERKKVWVGEEKLWIDGERLPKRIREKHRLELYPENVLFQILVYELFPHA